MTIREIIEVPDDEDTVLEADRASIKAAFIADRISYIAVTYNVTNWTSVVVPTSGGSRRRRMQTGEAVEGAEACNTSHSVVVVSYQVAYR